MTWYALIEGDKVLNTFHTNDIGSYIVPEGCSVEKIEDENQVVEPGFSFKTGKDKKFLPPDAKEPEVILDTDRSEEPPATFMKSPTAAGEAPTMPASENMPKEEPVPRNEQEGFDKILDQAGASQEVDKPPKAKK